MDSNMWWIGPLVLIVLRLLQTEARAARADSDGEAIVFRASRGIRGLFTVGTIGFLALVVWGMMLGEFWLGTVIAGLLALAAFSWPSTILLTQRDIAQSFWWRSKKQIEWEAVSGVEKRAGGEVLVYGREGASIEFTRYHVDPSRFVSEVLRRAALDGVIDSASHPTLR